MHPFICPPSLMTHCLKMTDIGTRPVFILCVGDVIRVGMTRDSAIANSNKQGPTQAGCIRVDTQASTGTSAASHVQVAITLSLPIRICLTRF